jgi:alanine racemase
MAESFIEINRANLLHNLKQFKTIASSAEIWPVIKSNAYGHGLLEIATILNTESSVAGFMVVNLQEAKVLREQTQKPIMVLSYFESVVADIKWAIDNNVFLPVYDLEIAQLVNDIAKQNQSQALVNIKIDTGTGRLGVRAEEAVAFIKKIQSLGSLNIFSLYSHLAESESDNLDFSKEQVAKFLAICDQFPQYKKHIACSAASISLAAARFDIIRLGLSLYGLWPSEATKARGMLQGLELKPVLSWQTSIIQIKEIKAGESIGYNRTYLVQRDCKIAILPLGYFEGYSRALSNKSRVLINGFSCPVRGNICMNLMMVELAPGQDFKVGDKVYLIGGTGDQTIPVEELALQASTINYEIVARLNPSILKKII